MIFRNRREQFSCAAAVVSAVLFTFARIFRDRPLLLWILAVLSILISAAALLPSLKEDIAGRACQNGLALTEGGVLLCLAAGRPLSGALALLLRAIAEPVALRLRDRSISRLAVEAAAGPLNDRLPQPEEIRKRTETLTRKNTLRWYPLFFLMGAVLLALLTVLFTGSFSKALSRAGTLLALGETAVFFFALPLGEYAALIHLSETGTLVTLHAAELLPGLRLFCARTEKPETVSGAAVFADDSHKLDGRQLYAIARTLACSAGTPDAETRYGDDTSNMLPETKTALLDGYGAAGSVGGVPVLIGSARLMQKAGLDYVPFSDGNTAEHVAVGGRHSGTLDFAPQPENEEELRNLLEAAGLYRFADESEAEEKRMDGELVLFLTPDGHPTGTRSGDLMAVSGAVDIKGADVLLHRRGEAAVEELLAARTAFSLNRRAAGLSAGVIKAMLILLAVFGLCPLWVAVAAESLVLCVNCIYLTRLK